VRDDVRRMALFTSGIAEMTRNRAEEFVRTWVHSGDLRREQAQSLVRELMEWSRTNRKELTRFVRTEIEDQLATVGVVTRRDLDRLEKRLELLEGSVRGVAATSARRTAPKSRKATARKSKSTGGRKKTSARRSTGSAGSSTSRAPRGTGRGSAPSG
jgi:polyhydroxyalkanoate synthesis regulator phasin